VAGLSGTGRVADDLYLAAHHETSGRPHLQSRAAGLGLAGGLLAELMLAGCVRLPGGRVVITAGRPPGDELASHVLGVIGAEREDLLARDWLVFLGRTAATDVAARLAGAGYLTRSASHRPWRPGRWVPVDADSAFAPLIRVKSALGSPQPPPASHIVLGGLATACGLGQRLELYLPPGTASRLDQAVGRLHPELRELIAWTQAAVDSALLAHRV
jgi:Golgi phosphoprotein 3 (GPP34)